MMNKEQQELSYLLEEFHKSNDGALYQNVINGLFRCPLLFPMGKEGNNREFFLIEQGGRKLFIAFTNVEEAEKGKLEKVDLTPFTIEEYCTIVAESEADGLCINMFDEKNCIINKEIFADVICPAFKENRIMPALKPLDGDEYIPIHKIPFSVGRSEQADLVIPENTINEVHALIIERGNQYYVVDRNTLNGVYVNGKEVPKGGMQQIVFDDVIEFYDAEYVFIPLGIAERKPLSRTMYGDERSMIANGVFIMQNHVLIREFYENTQNFVEMIEKDMDGRNYSKYYLKGLEMTCGMREKELNVTDSKVIEEQRKLLYGMGMRVLQDSQYYGFHTTRQDGMTIYIAEFPEVLHQIPKLAKRMYFLVKETGGKAVYMARNTGENVRLEKVAADNKETDCGMAPETAEEELQKVVDLGV